jgi:hypothetical protein
MLMCAVGHLVIADTEMTLRRTSTTLKTLEAPSLALTSQSLELYPDLSRSSMFNSVVLTRVTPVYNLKNVDTRWRRRAWNRLY